MPWSNVGGPGRTVMRSFATISSTFGTSNTWNGTMVAPRRMHDIQPALYPKAWKKGFTMRYR